MRFLKTIFLTVFFVITGAVSAQKALPDSCTDPNLWEYYNWKSEGQQCLLTESVSIELHASYPKALTEKSPFVKSVIFDYINQERREFWKFTEYTTKPQDDGRGWIMVLEIRSELFQHSDDIVSVLFNQAMYDGPGLLTDVQTFTFDLKTDKVLTLKDIFIEDIDPYTTVATFIREGMLNQWGDGFERSIVSGTVPIPENYEDWVLTDKSLDFHYPGWFFLSPKSGPTMVAIPLIDLKDSIKPEFLPKP
jgi:hypothetical protein